MKNITKIIAFVSIAALFISCASGPSLQKYYIDSQDDKNFISLDVPASIIKLKDSITTEEKEALSSLKKFNILAFKKDATNEAELAIEKKKVKAILKNPKFIELMTIKDKRMNLVLKYEGEDDRIDELIIYASSKEYGFALVRVLGDNMNPANIMKLTKNISKVDSDGFKQLEGIFKNVN